MKSTKSVKLNMLITALIFTLIIIAFSIAAFAASVPSAHGRINSSDGAVLRKSSSTGSAKVCVLSDNTYITIHKEVFKSKTSTSKKNKWYYVTANGKKGYVRADLVNNIEYGSVTGKIKAKVNYRKGAGTKMKKKGSFKKGVNVTVILKAKPVKSTKGTSGT